MFVASAYQIFQILALIKHVFSYVPAPVNVSAVCHNFQNVIYWNYTAPSLKPQFSVTVQSQYAGDSTVLCSNTLLYHCDVSSVTRVILDNYLFTLTAAVGTQRKVSEISFSYDETMNIDSDVKCFLDFPPVNISAVSKDMIKVEFPHPLDRYKEYILQDEMEDHDMFEYDVTYKWDKPINQFTCSYEETPVCVAEVHVDVEEDRHCVVIKGKLKSVNVLEQMLCTKPIRPGYRHIWIIVGIFGTVVLVCLFIFIMMWLQRKLSSNFSPLPKFMSTNLSNGPVCPLISPVSDTMSELHAGPSLSQTPEEPVPDETPTFVGTMPEDILRLPTGITKCEPSSEEGISSNAWSGPSLEEESGIDPNTGYDCPHGVIVPVEEEMSPGDTVTGYRCEI